MKELLRNWWSASEAHEKNALVVLGVILAGIFIFTSGIALGRIMAVLV
ncbi:hypothetical protein [Microbulbifer aggregans]|nr:hypothetical protein [Microbulbifer aggregans]